jgi:hypothetical protein
VQSLRNLVHNYQCNILAFATFFPATAHKTTTEIICITGLIQPPIQVVAINFRVKQYVMHQRIVRHL